MQPSRSADPALRSASSRPRKLSTLAGVVLAALFLCAQQAATPGLPFTEDFTGTALRDQGRTTADWSPTQDALLLTGIRPAGPWGISVVGTAVGTPHGTRAVAAADLDGDGDLDLVTGNSNQPLLSFFNDESGDPWNGGTGTAVSTDANDTRSVALGDVDADGDIDIVAGNSLSPNRFYRNNGSLAPWSGTTGTDITSDAYDTRAVVLGDVDGDGDLDLVTGNGSGTHRLYLNNGTADPWEGVTGRDITADAHDTRSIGLGDVDGDGDLDLVAGNALQPSRLYLNNGTADPWVGVAGTDITSDARDVRSVALGDVDGDGDLDLATGCALQVNRVYFSNGTADPWAGASGIDITADAHDTASVTLRDIDGDGDLDLVAGNRSQVNRLYPNNGTSDPWADVEGLDMTSDAHDTHALALADIDDDGDPDLVAGNPSDGNRYYAHNGTGDPWPQTTGSDVTADARSARSVASGDVDGDGDDDLVVGNWNQTNRLYLNDGSADPWAGASGTDITGDAHQTWSVVLADVDSDGDLDLIAGNYGATNRLYLNNGTSDPWNGVAGTDITSDANNTYAIGLEDVDGDGDTDLVAGNNFQRNRLYLNNGTADPWAGVSGTDITSDAMETRALELGDVDSDGDIDLVTGEYQQPDRLYLNNGTADPWAGVSGSDVAAATLPTYTVTLGDVDRDGDEDLLAAGRLYSNNGTADPFAGAAGVVVALDSRSAALGDVDGDGDLDLVTGRWRNDNRVFLNNGTADPWNGVTGVVIGDDPFTETWSVVLTDADDDGDPDLVAANNGAPNRYYPNERPAVNWSDASGADAGLAADDTRAVALGDVDGDGDLDLVAGNALAANRLYLNDGSGDPWVGSSGAGVTADAHDTRAIALGDVDGDGDLDLVAGNTAQTNRLYLNDGSLDPWGTAVGTDITTDAHDTRAVSLEDVDGDGDLDLVAGNRAQANRLYLNNGTATPWSGVTGTNISTDAHDTRSVALGDVDGDGDPDLVVGNRGQTDRLYVNNGTSDPWAGVTGVDVSTDLHDTSAVLLADVDADGDLDLVTGNDSDQRNRLYLGDGGPLPWSGSTGSDIGTDAHSTLTLALADLDRDGDPDLVAGNGWSQPIRLYSSNGTADPWPVGTGADVTSDVVDARSLAIGDADGDGRPDLLAGNATAVNRLYRPARADHVGNGRGVSLEVDDVDGLITNATLTALADLPPNTAVDYWLSANGGNRWVLARPGVPVLFHAAGSDLRWRAELSTRSPSSTPAVDEIRITSEGAGDPIEIGDRVWKDLDGDGTQDGGEPGVISALVYLYDDQGTLIDFTFTDAAGSYVFTGLTWNQESYRVRFVPSPGHTLAPPNQGGDDSQDSDADPVTGYTSSFKVFSLIDDTRWDAGMVPAQSCSAPDEPVYIYQESLADDGVGVILHFMDPNQPDQVTGYNIYRSLDPGLPHENWDLVADDVIDMDEATPNKQWVDPSPPAGLTYYQIAAYNHFCPAEIAEGPW